MTAESGSISSATASASASTAAPGTASASHLATRLAESTPLRLAWGHACVERVRHLLEDPEVIASLDVLAAHVRGQADDAVLAQAAERAARSANTHQGSRSLDGVGHAAVSASYAVANALAGRAVQAADYAAYATVYGEGGYGAVADPESFTPERTWQQACLQRLAAAQ